MTDVVYKVPKDTGEVTVTVSGGGGGGSCATKVVPDAFNSWRLLRILRSRLRQSGAWVAIAPDLRKAIDTALDGDEQSDAKEVL